MRHVFIYAVMLCGLQACTTLSVIEQAKQQAEINKIISASLNDRLIAYYSLSQEC